MAIPLIGAAIGAVVAGGASLLAFGPGIGDFFTRSLNETFQQRIATAAELINAFRRGDLDEGRMKALLRENGFDEEQQRILLQSSKTPLNVSEILTLWFRFRDTGGGEFRINKQWLDSRLGALGIPKEQVNEVVEANRAVPSLDDVIRFAVRDVFEEQAVRLGRLDEGLPDLFVQEAGKRGLNKQDATFIWRAHWLFPSLNQMFEMFHRLFDHPDPSVRFTRADMDTAFNVADIAPGMRARLQAIAFRPIGRVDIRRFDRLRVFGEGEERKQKIIRRYRELGFSQDNAEVQARFTMELTDRQRSPFSQAQILKNFREGLPEGEAESFAREQLKIRGLTDSEIDTLLELERARIISVDTQVQIDKIREDFVSGRIRSEAVLRDRLNGLGLNQGQVRELFEDITESARKALRRPSISQADKMLQAGIINETQWREIARVNGFAREDQDRLLQLVGREESDVKKLPSKSDIIDWFTAGVIDGEEFQALLREIGFAPRFVRLFALANGVVLE